MNNLQYLWGLPIAFWQTLFGALVGGLLSMIGGLIAAAIAEERRARADDFDVLRQIHESLVSVAKRSLHPGETTYKLLVSEAEATRAFEDALTLMYRLRSKRGRRIFHREIFDDVGIAAHCVHLSERAFSIMDPKKARSFRSTSRALDKKMKQPTHREETIRELLKLARFIQRRRTSPTIFPREDWETALNEKEADNRIFELVMDLQRRNHNPTLQAWREWQTSEQQDITIFINALTNLLPALPEEP